MLKKFSTIIIYLDINHRQEMPTDETTPTETTAKKNKKAEETIKVELLESTTLPSGAQGKGAVVALNAKIAENLVKAKKAKKINS